jgi:hypothetical protein
MLRRLLCLVVLFLSVSVLAPGVGAQDATPSSGLTELDLPTLDITVTANAYEGIPETLEAGRYLVTVAVAADAGEFGGGVGFVQPAGMTADEFIGFLGDLAAPAAEPGSEPIGTPEVDAGEEDPGMLPPFVYESVFAGGTYAEPGESSQIVLDFTPGEWVAWGDDPAAPWAPVKFEATGDMPAELEEPESSATITMGEYLIEVTEGELVKGPQLIRIDNIGAQPHFITSGTTKVAVTDADIEAVLESEMTGTPPAVDFNFETDFEESFFSGSQSNGTSIWIPIDLTPGNLVMLCYFPDLGDGAPHAYHGMYSLVSIPD